MTLPCDGPVPAASASTSASTNEHVVPGIGERFNLPSGHYFLSHSVGLLPKATEAFVADGLIKTWRDRPEAAWPSWLDEVLAFRQALADLFNHQPEWFCPQANVSSGLTKLLHSLPFCEDKPVILVSAEAFPSVGFVCRAAERLGYRVRLIEAAEDCQDPAVWRRHLVDDVGVVIVTHVHSNTGQLLPVAEIAELAAAVDAFSVLDAAQSAGIIPIDLGRLGFDAAVGSCVKWLCGGPGAGYLFVRPERLEHCRPVDVGWFSHADPFEFDIDDFRYADDALRFWGGTPNVASLSIASRSLQVLADLGVERIQAHNLTLTSRILDHIGPDQLISPRRPNARSGTVVVRVRLDDGRLVGRLAEAGVQVDQRATGIRISPHIYNDLDDVGALVEVLGQHLL